MAGDPLADAAIEDLEGFDRPIRHSLINAGMQGDDQGMREAPDSLKTFFRLVKSPPPVRIRRR